MGELRRCPVGQSVVDALARGEAVAVPISTATGWDDVVRVQVDGDHEVWVKARVTQVVYRRGVRMGLVREVAS